MNDDFKKWLEVIEEEHRELERIHGKRIWKPGGWTQLVGERDEETGETIRNANCWALFRVHFREDCRLHKWINHYFSLQYGGVNEDVIGGFDSWGIEYLIPEIDWKLPPLGRVESFLEDLWEGEVPELITDQEALQFSNMMITEQMRNTIEDASKYYSKTYSAPGGWYCNHTDSMILNFEEHASDPEPELVNQFLTIYNCDKKVVGARLDYASKLNREISEHRNFLSERRRNSPPIPRK